MEDRDYMRDRPLDWDIRTCSCSPRGKRVNTTRGSRGKPGFPREARGGAKAPPRRGVERTGIEPVTSGLQSRRSPS